MLRNVFFVIALALVQFLNAQTESRLLRFPAIHGNQIVFTYSGDLYSVDADGGMARKLTSDDGYEMFARFSPDGKTLAFTAQYDGNTEVYMIPAEGGSPKRLTYTATLGRDDISDRMGPNNVVMDWKNNEQIIFRSRKQSFNSFKGQLFLANVEGGLVEELPLPSGGFCTYNEDGSQLAFNRVFREFRTWKYYKGGMADDVWIYNFETKETTNITNNDAQDIFPMWAGGEVYFLSDRDRIMNLFAYNIASGETRKVTNYTEYDIKFPSLGDNKIAYENGGYIYYYDIQAEESIKVSIEIADDFLDSRAELKDASKSVDSYAISPDGKRITLGARGDVFSIPVKQGITRNLTESSGVHDRNVEWSPDGKYISFISDRTGEDEIYIQDQSGVKPAIQVTDSSDTYKYNPIWSPDSKKLLWSDKMQRLQYIDIETKVVVVVDETLAGEIRSYNWSPDSKWITYPKPVNNEMTRIWIFNTESKETKPVTDIWYNSGDPSFSSDGKYLFFSSSRDFNPIYSWTEWNHAVRDMIKPYFLTLQKDTKNPMHPVNDEIELANDQNKDNGKDKAEVSENTEVEAASSTIDFDGIIDRIIGLPVEAGYYWSINAIDNSVYYCMGNSSSQESKLKMFDLSTQKETELGDYGSYIISANHKKMLLSKRGKYSVIDLPKGKINADESVDLSDMKIWVNLKEEWKQIFDESWRQMRDFFYDPNMHGMDWDAVHAKYSPLIPYVNNRNDLNYIIGEMIGELNVGHAYVSGGDKASPERIKTGLLGATLIKDESGFYKIEKILKGENWTSNTRSPFTEVGVDVNESDFIIAVNGKPTNEMTDIYAALMGTVGKQVELCINSTATPEGGKKIIIVPIGDESNLYYFNWVRDNIAKVDEATNGQVGYIHIPDMGPGGLQEFIKYYYPQLKKRALIIDDRGNGGGNVSPMIIERLRREISMMAISRNGEPESRPRGMVNGPKVLLIDNYSASDGDLFPYQFKHHKLGKLIGVRTWGGVVGIRGSLPFIDGGQLMRPEFAHFAADGSEFIIEGRGVEPDIEIDNDPAKEYAGEDEQLNKAIEVILEELEEWPERLPETPDYPDKSK
jgi:tricorn protease